MSVKGTTNLTGQLFVGGRTNIKSTLSVGGASYLSGLKYPTSDGAENRVLATNGFIHEELKEILGEELF